MELLRPESRSPRRRPRSATAAVALAGGTELVPLLRDGLVEAETLVDLAGVVPRGVDGDADRRRHDARRARGRPADPGGAPRGLPARRLAAAPGDGDDRRQPAPGDALLVLAAAYPCWLHGGDRCHARDGRAPRARDLRQQPLRLGAPVRPGGGAARALGDRADRPARASRSPSSTACRPRTTGARRRSSRRGDPRARGPRPGREHVPEGDGPASAGRSRSSASPPRGRRDVRIALARASRRSRGRSTASGARRGDAARRAPPTSSSWRARSCARGRGRRGDRLRRRRGGCRDANREHRVPATARSRSSSTRTRRRNAVASFVELAQKGYFDGTVFHRVVPGLRDPGRRPDRHRTGRPRVPDRRQPSPDTAYTKGVVAMAKTATDPPGTAGSQFFVVTAEDAAGCHRTTP